MNSKDKYEAEKAEIMAIYHENRGRFGYRRITVELNIRNFTLTTKQSRDWRKNRAWFVVSVWKSIDLTEVKWKKPHQTF